MKDPIGILILRHQAVIDSGTDAQFYENVHGYMDVIFKTPTLDEIMKKWEKEYRRVAIQILDANHEQKGSMLMRNERFNLFARDFCEMLNIYEPIEDYKNHPLDPDSEQDPNAILLLKGFKYLDKVKTGPFNKDSNKHIARDWNGKRKWYQQKLQRFHIDLVTEIGKSETTPIEAESVVKEKEPLPLSFDEKESLLHIQGYSIKINKQKRESGAHKLLKLIFLNPNRLNKSFDYCDIAEKDGDFEYDENPMSWQKYYKTAQKINEKISLDTNSEIKDFLQYSANSTGSVRINEKYIKTS